MKRRQFSQFVALLAGSAAVPAFASAPFFHRGTPDEKNPEYLSRAYFEQQLGQEFSLCRHEAHRLRLEAVEDSCSGNRGSEQFHAIFEVTSGTPLHEGIYLLEDKGRPHMCLFMTCSERAGGRQRLVATVNRHATA